MKNDIVVGPDQTPSPETLLKWFQRLDRQILEIKSQMWRGVLTPVHVQALIEHRNPFADDPNSSSSLPAWYPKEDLPGTVLKEGKDPFKK